MTADQKLPDSARTSYDFYSLYWAPEYGPILVKLRGHVDRQLELIRSRRAALDELERDLLERRELIAERLGA